MSGASGAGEESKTLVRNPGDCLSDGVRIPEESEVRVEGSVNGGETLGICNFTKHTTTAEIMSKGWKTRVVMGMVERVLGGNHGVDNGVKDIDTARNGLDLSMASDRNVWQGMVGGPPSKNGININKTADDGDSGYLNSGYRDVGNRLNGNQDSVFDGVVPYGKMETEEFNDHCAGVLIPKERGEFMSEEEGEFYVSDLVWGKVCSHPWWPGQIIEPSAASNKAKRHIKKNCYLIAYFGDHTFAWNEGSKIKYFRKHFLQMKKQSNADRFVYAVDCALDEVARRVELGLSCRCVPQVVRDRISSQEVVNPGLQEASRRRVGGDCLTRAIFFSPEDIMHSLESLAQSPRKINKLQFVVTKAQLLTFNRLHGRYQFPIFENCGRFLEDDSQFNWEGEAKGLVEVMDSGPGLKRTKNIPSKKRKSTAQGGSSRKRKHLPDEKGSPKKKEKYLSALMSGRDSSIIQNEGIIPSENLVPDRILSELIFAASNPLRRHETMKPILGLLCRFRKFVCPENSTSGNAALDSGKLKGKQTANIEATEDSYWTDRTIQSYCEDPAVFASKNPKEMAAGLIANLDQERLSVSMNEASEEYFPTALILNFTRLESIPSIPNLNEIFGRYGPLEESETKILSKSKRAKVIFKRQQDAETAFSSTGKYSIFGPSLLSYRLNYAPTRRNSKRSKKGSSSEVNAT